LSWTAGEALRDHIDSCDACRDLLVQLARGTPAGMTPKRAPLELAATEVAALQRRGPDLAVELPPRFAVERLLGQGGMGRVYAARDTELDRPVAVKVMRQELGGNELAQRLVRESKLMARLSHPGVVTIYDVGRHAEHVFIAMELVDGATLHQWLRSARKPWQAIVDVFCRAGEGLAAAHAAGLVHRDVKPDNILLALTDGRVTRVAVSDFGVARAARDASEVAELAARTAADGDVALTAAGALIGTPAYMAPEQLDGQRVDARADIFSFGVSLWEALWGERPYRGATIAEIAAATRDGAPPPPARPSDRGATTAPPRWVVRAVHAAIEPDPARRPPTMAALLAQLDPHRHAGRRTVAFVAGAAVLLTAGAAAAIAAVPRGDRVSVPALCTDDGLAAVWTDGAHALIRSALAALPGDVAGSVADRALRAGDAYARRWAGARALSCAFDEPRRRDAAAVCLDARRRAMAAFVARVPAMKRVDLVDLDQIAATLPSPELCQTDAAQLVVNDSPPILRGEIAALEGNLAELDTLRASGDVDGAGARLTELGPAVAATGSRVLVAEHAYARAMAMPDRETSDAVVRFRDAAIAASKAGRDDLAAKAWLEVARAYTSTLNDAGRAGDALALADGAIARGGDDPNLRIRYELDRANLAMFDGKYADAGRLLSGLRARAERDAPDLVDSVDRTAISLATEAGTLDDAIAAARALIARTVRRLGESHADTISAYGLLANAQLAAGDMKGVLDSTRTAAELAKRGYGADSDAYGLALRNYGTALDAAGQTDAAITAIHAARAILEVTRGPRNFMVGDTYHAEATALSAANRAAEALPLYDQAIAIYRTSVGEHHIHTAEAQLDYATALAQLDRGAEAVAHGRAAVAVFRATYGEDNPRYAVARATLGEALIHAHDRAAARVELEAAVAVFAKVQFDPVQRFGATFNLAQALGPDPAQHARAMQLANEALAFFETAGPQWQDAVVHMKQWTASGGKD